MDPGQRRAAEDARGSQSLVPVLQPPYRGDPAFDTTRQIPPDELEVLRWRWWSARTNRIQDAASRVHQCLSEVKMEKQKAMVHENLRGEMLRDVQICQRRIDLETELLAEIIVLEAMEEEKSRMPQPWKQKPAKIFQWAVTEAKSADPVQNHRWACVLRKLNCPPPVNVDQLPQLSASLS
ncbi:hypothetical protein VPH35_092779 [Triticum aestivum]